jgi:hypothetical protein
MTEDEKGVRNTIWPAVIPANRLKRHWNWAERRDLIEHGFEDLIACQAKLAVESAWDVSPDFAKIFRVINSLNHAVKSHKSRKPRARACRNLKGSRG